MSLGPVLGGTLVDGFGWRSIFLINLPVGLAGIWLACRFLKESAPRPAGFDFVGQVLATLSLGLLTGGIIASGAIG